MNVLVTGDVKRPIIEQSGNIKWFYFLIKQALVSMGWNVTCLPESGEHLPKENWILDDCNWLKEEIKRGDHSFVIGFEMSERMRQTLLEMGVSYLDVICHPIRFLDDLVFGVKASPPLLFPESICDAQIKAHANFIRATHARHPSIHSEPFALIVGQTPFDKSVLIDGEFRDVFYFQSEMKEIMLRHKKVFLKPHPSGFALDMRSCELDQTSTNIYALLSDKNLECVYGINSSVLTEAHYFEKKSKFLGKPWHLGYTPVHSSALLEPVFWSRLTGNFVQQPFYIEHMPSRIRKSCDSFWGYQY